MPKMVMLITAQIDRGIEVAEAWEAAGATGITLIDSYGLHNLRERSQSLELSLFVSMANVMRQIEQTNQTLITVVDEELVDSIVDAACEVLGGLKDANSGVIFVLPVEGVHGISASKRQNNDRS